MGILDGVPGFEDVEPAYGDERHRGQLRIAERLVDRHRDRLRFVHGIGWHVWDGMRWARDTNGAAMRAAINTVRAAYADLGDLDRGAQAQLLADIHRCESATGLDGVLRIAGSVLPIAVSVDQLDADPYLFNVTNGTLDLRTGQLRPHNPRDLVTKVAGCGYDRKADAPRFEQFLAEIQPDPATRSYVARVLGHALVGQVTEHLLPICTGSGQNGKSTLIDTVMAVFGDYAMAAEPDLLVDRGAVHTTGQADLLGVRWAVCSETDEGRKLAAANVKRLTGGDKVRAATDAPRQHRVHPQPHRRDGHQPQTEGRRGRPGAVAAASYCPVRRRRREAGQAAQGPPRT